VWVFQAVNYLDIMVEDGRNYVVYFNYTILNFPKIISKILPFAVFLSFYYVLIKYESNNELIIFWNFGISKIQVINFFLKFSLMILFLQIIFASLIVPKSQDLARSILKNSDINFFDNFLKPKKFNDIIKGVTIYSESKDENGLLKNIYIKKITNQKEFEITYAKRGEIKTFGTNQVLVLFDGENIKGKKDNLNSFSFSKSDFNLTNLDSNTITHKKTQQNSTIDLFQCYKNLTDKNFKGEITDIENCRQENKSNILAELYKRLIIPFYLPILILISLLSILTNKEDMNYFKNKIYIFLLGLFIIIFSETTLRFVKDNLVENIKLLSIPFLILIILYSIIGYKLNSKIKI
tara:strand:+ start:1365 stop:2414 length:1050 start_codon:yes stop_codon:yes gene_type:complete